MASYMAMPEGQAPGRPARAAATDVMGFTPVTAPAAESSPGTPGRKLSTSLLLPLAFDAPPRYLTRLARIGDSPG